MHNISFLGRREDKNTVEQLRQQGDALTLNNQRNISTAIDKLAEDSSEENIKFLMNVAQGLRYGTSFELDNKRTNNDWKGKLQQATEKALANTDSPNKAKLQEQFKATFIDKKELSKDEKDVLSLRNNLLKTPGLPKAINDSKIDAVKNIAKNLDYFVISSEITTKEKKSCLEKLNKLMSPEYKINSQLKNKKPQVLGELLNDLVVRTAESDKPTIKTTDQRHHGMCAAISTSRKVMAYEYKDKYVTMIMEELNNKPEMKVYDPTKLGTDKKISVPKTEVDFDYADDKGYRILDASALQWMNIAGNSGRGDVQATKFSAFDRKYFDTFHDAHYMRDLDDPKLVPHQHHLRALEKAEEFISSASKGIAKREKDAVEQRNSERFNAQTVAKANAALNKELSALMPDKTKEEMNKVVNKFLKMGEVNGTQSDELHFFDYEEESMKKQKMANFIKAENPNVNQKDIDSRMANIFNMYELSTETTEYMNKEIIPKSPKNKMQKLYKPLYEAAASYRTAQDKKLDIPEELSKEVKKYGLSGDATKADVMKKYENEGKVVAEPVLRSLQEKYNKIAKYAAVVEKAEVKDNLNLGNLYNMSTEEKQSLDKVAKNLNKMYAEVSKETKAKQKQLEKPLNDLAREVGQEQGRYWVTKEGSSGLFTAQEVRILEQMTGKPYYAEESVERTAEKIKKGPHSGISATSVYHNQHGGHAQYIADVAPLLVKDAKTGKIEVKDAIMHDNTWGAAEHKKTWLDSKGLLRTDYQCGRGGKDGYITNSAWQNGTLVEDYKYEPGSIGGEKFKLFYNGILPTVKNDTTKTAATLVQNAFVGPMVNMSKVARVLQKLDSVPAEFLDKVMDRAANAGETKDFIETQVLNDLEKVNSETDLAKTHKRTQEYMTKVAKALSFTKNDALKAFEEGAKISNVTEKNIDTIENQNFQFVKHFIDEKFDPKSNKEFIEKFNELKKMPADEVKNLINNSSDKELNLKNVTPYEAVRQIKGLEPDATKALEQQVLIDSIQDNIKLTPNEDSFEESFFMLQRDWGNLNISNDLKQVKDRYFAQYGARSAFPDVALVTKKETSNLAKKFSDSLKQGVELVSTLKQMQDGKIDKQGLTDEQIATAMKNQLADLKEGKRVFIEANIEPKHRHSVAENLNKYLSDAVKGKNTDESYKKFVSSFDKHHILNHPNEMLREFIKLSKDPEQAEMAQIYEGYVVKGCHELAKLETNLAMTKEASKGHMHEVAQDISSMKTPAVWDKEAGEHDLSTDDGFYAFLGKAQQSCGVDNTLKLLNHIGQNDRAMRLEMAHIKDIDEMKANLSKATLLKTINFVKNKSEFVEGLNLSKAPKESKMREEYIVKLNDLIQYVNSNAGKILSTAK